MDPRPVHRGPGCRRRRGPPPATTAPVWPPPTPPTDAGYPNSTGSNSPAIREATTWWETGAANSSSSTPLAHSRLICAAGLRAMAQAGPSAARTAHCTDLADALIADTTAHSLHPSGRWQRSPGDPGLDGALLPPVRGALPADDPRTTATLRAYPRQLADTTTSPTASATTDARSTTRRARSCCADSPSPWRNTNRATRSKRTAGSSGTAPLADRRACTPRSTPRSTTSVSDRCAAACPKPSYTP